MKFHQQNAEGNVIQALPKDGGVKVGGVLYVGGLVVCADWLLTDWRGLDDSGWISTAALAQVAGRTQAGDVVLLGWGENSPLPQPAWQAPFIEKKSVLEVMSLRAACRTYNIMLADSRPVIAALILD